MASVRIIKRAGRMDSSPRSKCERTGRQNEREIACTVKNWITELAQRRLEFIKAGQSTKQAAGGHA